MILQMRRPRAMAARVKRPPRRAATDASLERYYELTPKYRDAVRAHMAMLLCTSGAAVAWDEDILAVAINSVCGYEDCEARGE